MNEKAIHERLVEHGQTLFRAPKQLIQFTRDDLQGESASPGISQHDGPAMLGDRTELVQGTRAGARGLLLYISEIKPANPFSKRKHGHNHYHRLIEEECPTPMISST
jgi:hypothetical protein